MNIEDRVYGTIEITEPVVLEVIKSKAIQRLNGIDQAGYSKAFYPGTEQTRFEHSLGVYHLLKRFSAAFDAQIAGLIHDVSHSAFSHSIDYVFGKTEKSQSHQDTIFESFIKKTQIPVVLAKHGIALDQVIGLNNFPLLEHDIPDLSADRIDYSLRTAVAFSMVTRIKAMEYVNALIVREGHWVFKSYTIARQYAELFLTLNRTLYSGPTSAVMFRTVGDCIRYALEKGYVTVDDLYGTDQEVLRKVKHFISRDSDLSELWARMNNKVSYSFTKKGGNAHVFVKSRIVDPLCLHNHSIKRVSDIDLSWKKVVTLELKPKEYFIRFAS